MFNKPLYYYLNKYFYFPPFLLWRWIGIHFKFKGYTYSERHFDLIKQHKILENTIDKIKLR